MKQFSNILFVADPAIDNKAAFNQAVTLANNNQAELTVMAVVNITIASHMLETLVKHYKNQLENLVEEASVDIPDVKTKVIVGKDFIEVIHEVLRHKRDLVIKSVEKGESIGDQLFGSTDMKLLRKCPCPVWLIKSTQQKGYRQILVGIDYEPDNPENELLNQRLLEIATSQALADFSELHIVHAWQLEHESFLRSPWVEQSQNDIDAMSIEQESIRRDWLNNIVNNYCENLGKESKNYIKPILHLIKGDPKIVVSECTDNIGAELVVVGTVGRTGIPGFIIGNTAESILNKIKCSVLAIKPEGFVSPVTL